MLTVLGVWHDRGTGDGTDEQRQRSTEREDKQETLGSTRGNGNRWSIVFVHYGSCFYRMNGESRQLGKGSVLLAADGRSEAEDRTPQPFHETYCISFELTAPELFPFLVPAQPLLWQTGMFERFADRFRVIHEQWVERQPYFQAICSGLLLDIVAHAGRELESGRLTPAKLRHVERMKAFIQERYREKVTKEDAGRHIGISPSYAATLFQEVTGQTISDYVHAQRIKTAVYLLRDSRLTTGEIAESVGYSDPSYFYRIFKRLTGHAPSVYTQERDEKA